MLKQTEKVAKFKLIARDALRMDLIKARQTKVSNLDTKIKDTTDCKAEYELDLAAVKYDITKLDTAHPKFDSMKKDLEEDVVSITEAITNHVDTLKDLDEAMKEQTDAIAKIESGETKVDLDSLNNLVSEMIKQDALNAVVDVK